MLTDDGRADYHDHGGWWCLADTKDEQGAGDRSFQGCGERIWGHPIEGVY